HEHRPDPRRKGRPSARALTLRAAGAARALDWGHRSSAARAAREHRTGPRRKGRPSARALELADGVRGHRRSGARAAREHRTGPRRKGRPSARALELADGVRGHRRSGARAAREHRTGPRRKGRPSARALELADGVRGHRRSGARAARGDLGQSIALRTSVTRAVAGRYPATLELAGAAFILALALALPLGVAAALRPGSAVDRSVRLASLAGACLPGFWLGPLLILLFSLRLGWLPVSCRRGLSHLVLPATALRLGRSAIPL